MSTFAMRKEGPLAWREAGAGPVLVLLHGWGVSGAAFEPVARDLAHRYRVVAPDLLGHGASDSFGEGDSFQRLADALRDFLAARCGPGTVLVGWSMGALVAWDLLARHGATGIKGLVSVDMVPRLLSGPDWPFGLRAGESAAVFAATMEAMRTDWPAFTGVFVPRILARVRERPCAELIRWLRAIAAGNDGAVMARLWGRMVEQDLRRALPRIDLPTLVMYGEGSQLYPPESARWIRDHMPRARLAGCAAAGHAPQLEAPRWFEEAVDAFASSLGAHAAAETTTTGTSRHAIN